MTEAQRLADLIEPDESGPGCVLIVHLRAAAAELRRLDAECEQLRADAARYLWLRNEAWGGNNKRGPYLVEFKAGYSPSLFTMLAEEAADGAIDAAIAKETK